MPLRTLKRREFLAAGAGLSFVLVLPPRSGAQPPGTAEQAGVATAWVDIATDDTVTIRTPAAEMGQGSMTSLPLILAEEMDADWNRVRIEFSPADDELFGNPIFWAYGIMLTAGSTAVHAYYKGLRLAGAQLRKLLLQRAAEHWRLAPAELGTEPGVVVHRASGRRLRFGEIAALTDVHAALPEVDESDLKDPQRFRLIGRQRGRRDVPSKTRGLARYSIDHGVPDMLHATMIRAPVPGARPLRVDDREARRIPGVERTITLEHGVAVIARSTAAALRAERALQIQWSRTPEGAGFDGDAALAAHAALARDLDTPGFVVFESGALAPAFDAASATYQAEYRTDLQYHAQMEPANALARITDGGRGVEIHAPTQTPTHLIRSVVAALGIASNAVSLHRTLLGGSFGARLEQEHRWVIDAALLARELGAPVKLLWSRESDLRAGRCRPMTAQLLRAAVNARGDITAWHHRIVSDEPLAQSDPYRYESGKGWPAISGAGAESPYSFPNARAEVVRQHTAVRLSPLRGVGATLNRFAAESFLDEIAAARRRDPLALRLELLHGNPAAQSVLRAAADLAGWARRDDLGISFVDEAGTYLATVAEVDLDRDQGLVRVRRLWMAVDVGVAVQPLNVEAQLEGAANFGISNALKERISIRNGAIEQSNFDDYPLLRMADAPDIEVRILNSDRAPSGCGEIACMGVVPAIANAVAAGCGLRLRHLPFTPARVLAALKA